jgi:hypothetical protein
MIGAISGRRSGVVTAACVDVWNVTNPTWMNGRYLCQAKANYSSQGGDSGAPVLTPFGDGTAWATGIHWGSQNATTKWFSPMDNVLNEFYLRLAGNPYLSPVAVP